MKNSQQDSLNSARYWFLLSHALKHGQHSNNWREDQQLSWKEPNWKAHCPRERKDHLQLLSVALGTGSVAKKNTDWNSVESSRASQRCPEGQGRRLHHSQVSAFGKMWKGWYKSPKAKSKNSVQFCEKNEKEQLSDSLVINRMHLAKLKQFICFKNKATK